MEILQVPIQEILKDESFRFAKRDPEKVVRLASSIKLSELLEPIWVRDSNGKYQILSGFSRFEAAKASGLSAISVRTISSEESLADVFYQVLLAHRISSKFDVIEKARILKVIKEFDSMESELRGQYLTLLELPEKRSILDEVEDLLSLEPEIQSYIETYGLALKQASQFLRFDAEEQRFCAELGKAMLIRPVELLAICTPLREISGRDDLSFQDLTEELGIPDLLNSDITRSLKIGEIKQRILEHRYPKLTEWNRSIETFTKSLGLPSYIQLKWDKTLETPGVQIQANLHSSEDMQNLVAVLSSDDAKKEFKNLFNVLS